jgi:hypothetical protein
MAMPKPRNHRGIFRPRYVAMDDRRCPMLRLLTDCNVGGAGSIEVGYEAQWKTYFKAQRLGYIADGRITEKGIEFVKKATSS